MRLKNFISNLFVGLYAGGGVPRGGGSADAPTAKPSLVSVHGAWHGGWCWSEVVRLLAERGYPSITLDLPGHGINARLPIAYTGQPQIVAKLATEVSPLAALTLTDFCDAARRVIRGVMANGSGPVNMVGHSLGGATLSAVGEAVPALIRSLVYLTAFVPIKFENVLAYLQQANFATSEVPALFTADPAQVGRARINHASADVKYQARNKSVFYGDVDEETFKVVANLMTPDEPIQDFTTPVVATVPRCGSLRRAYVRCTADLAIPIASQDEIISDADTFTPASIFFAKEPGDQSFFFCLQSVSARRRACFARDAARRQAD